MGSSTCSHLNPPLLFISKTHVIKGHCMSYQQVWFWSHTSWVTNYKTLTKKRLFQSVSETPTSRKRRKNYKKGYCKTFYVTRNTKGNQDSVLQSFLRYTKMKLINIYNNTCYSKLQKRLWYSFFPMLSFQTNKTCNFCLLYIIEGP